MKSFVQYIIIIVILAAGFSSCRKVVTDKFPDYPQKITVNSIAKAGEPLLVNVSLTGNINDSTLAFVDNAAVNLYINGNLAETLSYEGDGYYVSTVVANENDSLECVVAYNGDTARCHCIVPHKEIPLGFEYIANAGVDDSGELLQGLVTTIGNIKSQRKYYEIKIYTVEGYDHYGGTSLMDITDPIIKNEGLPLPLFSNELASGENFSVTLKFMTHVHGGAVSNDTLVQMIRPILVRFRAVDENYYKFTRMHYLYYEGRYSEGIIDNPVVFNVYSNVENGLGVFAAYTEYTDTIYPPNVWQR